MKRNMHELISSQFNPFWYVGSIIAAWTCFGTSHMGAAEHWKWRIPSLLQAVIPCLILPMILMMPESPRWLCANGRKDEALSVLARYHANGNASDDLVVKEMAEIELAIEQGLEGVTWREMATNKKTRKRVLIVLTMTLMTLWWYVWYISC